MRRALVVLATVMCVALSALPVQAQMWRDHRVCQLNHSGYSIRQVKALIRCASARFPVQGGPSKALAVAYCESRYYPHATLGIYHGVFALSDEEFNRVWAQRRPLWHRWGVRDNIWDGQANVLLGVHKAHTSGSWSSWSCG